MLNAHRRLPRLLMGGLLSFLLLWGALAAGLDAWGQRQAPMGTWDAVVIAGCRVQPGGHPSLSLARRVERGVDLWRSGVAPLLIFTGGLGTHPPTEAEAAARYALSLGVPLSAIRTEDRSTSTEENARMAVALLPSGARILVVTDSYHAWRARRVFARYFADVSVAASITRPDLRTRGALREVLAIGWYGLRGRLSIQTPPQSTVDPAPPL